MEEKMLRQNEIEIKSIKEESKEKKIEDVVLEEY